MKNITYFLLILVLLSYGCSTGEQPKSDVNYLNESKEDFDERMEWWRNARFGMFIHWGLYAVPAGIYNGEARYAEWIMNQAGIPVEEYEKYADDFNPEKFDADEWVKIAMDAGMKYMVITSKHHDGFAIYDSEVSDYDIMDRTPYKKDVLKALSEACKKAGLPLGFYYSILDWHHPKAKGQSFAEYRDNYMKPQLKEIVTNYDISILWFDGEWIEEWTEDQGKELYNYVRNLKPDIIINNRVGKGRQGMQGMNKDNSYAGDFGTPEQEILEGKSDLDWESCMTINGHWGYASYDENWKSSEMLIHNLIDITAKGGNYLLNVGPTAEGEIPGPSVARLKDMGNWTELNGSAIYNTKSVENYVEGGSIYYTISKDETVNIILTEWPTDDLNIKYFRPKQNSTLRMLGYDKELNWNDQGLDGITIEMPDRGNIKGKFAWVIKAEGNFNQVAQIPVALIDGKTTEKYVFSEEVEIVLQSSTPNGSIYYTIDGSEPDKEAMLYKGPFSLNKGTILKMVTIHDEYVTSETGMAELIQTMNVKSIDMTANPAEKYKAFGPLSLGDNLRGGSNLAENWLGFEGKDVEVVIDLGENKSIENIILGTLQRKGSWIFYPESVEFSVSKDNGNYKSISNIEVNNVDDGSLDIYAEMGRINARYVKLSVTGTKICPEGNACAGEKSWLFMDEIIIN